MTFRSDLRTAAAILISAAALVALAASGEATTDSGGNKIGTKTDSDKSGSGDSKSDKPDYTPSQENAITAAKNYLNTQGFSKKGLIEQLSASSGDGYPHSVAVFAVKHLDVSWKKQAALSAKEYLNSSTFSCQGMVEQLSSSAGSGYTLAQAQYGAKKVGLC